MSYPNKRDCRHGRQRGHCPECELESLEQKVAQLREVLNREYLFKEMSGCTNHGCITGKNKGHVGTNGSCSCLPSASRAQLQILRAKLDTALSRMDDIYDNE